MTGKRTKEGPQPLTIEEYKRRQQRTTITKDESITPPATKLTRRGGYTQKLKRERAILLRLVNNDPPPSWQKASSMWRRIDEIEFLVEQYTKFIKKNTT